MLLVLAGKTGSFAVAGSGVAVAGIGGAASGPAVGAWSERIGQRRVVGALTAAQSVFLVVLLVLQARPVSSSLLVAVAGLVGMANPAIGSMARAQRGKRRPQCRPGPIPEPVMAGFACPGNPVLCVPLPGGREVHALTLAIGQ